MVIGKKSKKSDVIDIDQLVKIAAKALEEEESSSSSSESDNESDEDTSGTTEKSTSLKKSAVNVAPVS